MKPCLFYREHALINEEERKAYDILRQGLKQYREEILVEGVAEERVWLIFQYITLDNPVILARGMRYFRDRHGAVHVQPEYPETVERHRSMLEEAKSLLLDTIAQANLPDNSFVKEQFIHDWLAQNIEYTKFSDCKIYTWYGVVRNRKAVCEGIAKAAKLMFDVTGIPNAVVIGKARSAPDSVPGPHAWNLVRLNGSWYHLDITFDNSFQRRTVLYDYYNLSDASIRVDHTVEIPLGVSCPDERMAWHHRNSICAADASELRIKLNRIPFRRGDTFTLKLPAVCDNGEASKKVMEIIQEELSHRPGGSNYSLRVNPMQMVFELCFR